MIWKVFYRRYSKETTINTVWLSAYVKAVDADDAKRILAENLDTYLYQVGQAWESDISRVTDKDIAIGFKLHN